MDDEAFRKGQVARQNGVPEDANPYSAETLPFYHWEEGWRDVDYVEDGPDA